MKTCKIFPAAILILIFTASICLSQDVQVLKDGSFKITDAAKGNAGIFKKVSKFADGTSMTDTKCDGVVYRKVHGSYVKRELPNGVDITWYNLNKKSGPDKKKTLDSAIDMANRLSLPVYLPDGELDAAPSVAPKKGFAGRGSISYKGALIYNPKTTYIGIPQNLDEKPYKYPNLIKDGEILKPGLAAKPTDNMHVDILAHWYNDFGLSSTALAPNQGKGAYVWYDWSWNHTNKPDYDPARHPLLGWYRGDDPRNLDWIAYWLVKYGVDGVIIDHSFSTDSWSNPKDKAYWIYQLFNNTPNFKTLKYAVWLSAKHGMSADVAKAKDNDMIRNVLARYKNVYSYEKSGKRYPVFYMWDMEAVRGIYDKYNGARNSIAYLKSLAKMCMEQGYDGICIYGRNLSRNEKLFGGEQVKNDLMNNGVFLFSQDYSTSYEKSSGGYNNQYSSYVSNVNFPKDPEQILTVLTSAKTQKPHPSNWKLAGTTPGLFGEVLKKAVDLTNKTDKPKVVVVYNVSEWAEAGPGLIPNQKDLFGYLEAVANVKKGQ